MNCDSLILLGDICPQFYQKKCNNKDVIRNYSKCLSVNDFVCANLESPVASSDNLLLKCGANFGCNLEDLTILKSLRIGAVSLANNHILDCGITGFFNTVAALKSIGVDYYGAGNLEELTCAYEIQVGDNLVKILSFAEREFNSAIDYGVGANIWDDFDGIKLIQDTKPTCDYLVVQYHGGIEYFEYPSPRLQKKCRAMAEAGADYIVCQHSHCVGTIEKWGESEILYGQGNTIFGYNEKNTSWNTGLMVKLTFNGNINISYIPIQTCKDGVVLMEGSSREEFLSILQSKSEVLRDPETLKKKWVDFCCSQKDLYLPLLFAKSRFFNKLNRLSKGFLMSAFTRKKSRLISMNLIRCDSHKEVCEQILENEFYHKN